MNPYNHNPYSTKPYRRERGNESDANRELAKERDRKRDELKDIFRLEKDKLGFWK